MTSSREASLRSELVDTCNAMSEHGLTFGTSGNASARLDEDSLLITPTGLPYASLHPNDIVHLRYDGQFYGSQRPSSEWLFHRDIMRERHDVNAVVHTHSSFATTLACQGTSIPSFHYMVAVAGGDNIRCAPYALFGTQALSDQALEALDQRTACLLANHGQLALGKDLSAALKMAGEVETLSRMFWQSLQNGSPILLSVEEMAHVKKKFEYYGKQDAPLDDGLSQDK